MPAVVPAIAQVIGLLGVALEVCLVCRLISSRLLSIYPYFSFYLFAALLRNASLPAAYAYLNASNRQDLYSAYYWNTETVGVLLRCLVVWEVFRHTFPSGSPLRKSVSRAFGMIALVLIVFTLGALWGYHVYGQVRSMNLILDRSFGFAQSVLILSILLVGRRYGVCLGRNLWGISVGFGAWMSLSTVNYALFDLTGSFFTYWQLVRTLSFIVLLLVWNWALWRPSHSPYLADTPLPAEALHTWTQNWNRAFDSLRKVRPQ
jgi:hypothetical protein